MTRSELAALASLLLQACSSGGDTPLGVKGFLVREGKTVTLDGAPMVVDATRCREGQLSLVELEVGPPEANHPERVDHVYLRIQGDFKKARLGEKFVPELFDERGRIYLFVSAKGLAELEFPHHSAWLRFRALSGPGPIDVELHADLGRLGRLDGRLRAETTREEACILQ